MANLEPIKKSSALDLASLTVKSKDATTGADVSTAGSPGDLTPAGFIPASGVAKWNDRSSGISIGYPTLTLSVRTPSKTSRLTRVQSKYSLPILEATSGITGTGFQPAPTVAYTLLWNSEFLLPERSSQADREKFLSVCVSLLSRSIAASDGAPVDVTGSPLLDAVLTYEPPY